ncbi:MAG: GspH/FimT family pseudopilin [Comamonas sp.]
MYIRHGYQNRAAAGFTAIELMVVVAILAILAALAGPSFNGLIERWHVRQAVEGLQSALYYARSEAIKRGGNVVMQKNAMGTNGCSREIDTTNTWDCGWFICIDTNASGTCTKAETVLWHFDTPANLQMTRCDGGKNITFNRWGMVSGSYLSFSVVPLDKSSSNPAALGLCMSSGGRIRTISNPTCPMSCT